MSTGALALIAVLATSLVSLLGIFFLLFEERRLRAALFFLVSVSAGALFGDAFIHLIPESFANPLVSEAAPFLVLLGIAAFFALEKFLHWHHHHAEEEGPEHSAIHPVGPLVLTSDVLHNFIDGVIIAASFYISTAVGLATTIAVMFHEIPHEIGNVSLLIHAGFSRLRAVVFNCLSAVAAIVGALAVIVFAARAQSSVEYLIPFAAGSFIYIAGSDLVPELHKDVGLKKALWQLTGLFIGVAAMAALVFLESR